MYLDFLPFMAIPYTKVSNSDEFSVGVTYTKEQGVMAIFEQILTQYKNVSAVPLTAFDVQRRLI